MVCICRSGHHGRLSDFDLHQPYLGGQLDTKDMDGFWEFLQIGSREGYLDWTFHGFRIVKT